jgi:hypothetical protein
MLHQVNAKVSPLIYLKAPTPSVSGFAAIGFHDFHTVAAVIIFVTPIGAVNARDNLALHQSTVIITPNDSNVRV